MVDRPVNSRAKLAYTGVTVCRSNSAGGLLEEKDKATSAGIAGRMQFLIGAGLLGRHVMAKHIVPAHVMIRYDHGFADVLV